MGSPLHAPVDWTFAPPTAGTAHTATGLPPGLAISPSGAVTGAATATGSHTVTVTAATATGSSSSVAFVWTTT